MEHSGKLDFVNQSRSIRTVGFRLHGVESGGGTEGQEVKQDGLVLLKTRLPDVGGRTGDTLDSSASPSLPEISEEFAFSHSSQVNFTPLPNLRKCLRQHEGKSLLIRRENPRGRILRTTAEHGT